MEFSIHRKTKCLEKRGVNLNLYEIVRVLRDYNISQFCDWCIFQFNTVYFQILSFSEGTHNPNCLDNIYKSLGICRADNTLQLSKFVAGCYCH